MSYDVDSRIVEMRFDNKQFEADVSHTIKTLDKLDAALQFEGAEKGFNEIEKASKGVKLDGLAASVEKIADKFTLLGTIQRKIFDDIGNRIVGLEHKFEALIKSMTLDQVMVGWDKYAEKTSSVQTIMAAVSNEVEDTGERMEYVNEQLRILNWFTDETSHKYTDMVNNIGKFTANQVHLDTAVAAMQGIATWASKSGANATEASRAMYNLSQAISVGALKVMDWKSIELANMATAEFKQTAIETAEEMGNLVRVGENLWVTMDGTEVSIKKFRETLQTGWLSSDVLLGTLNKYGDFALQLKDAVDMTGITATEFLRAIEEYRDGILDIDKMAQEAEINSEDLSKIIAVLADESNDFGRQAFIAAQEAKTLGEAIDYVKEATATGWMNTFEIIFGDYAEAKRLWTDVAEYFYEVFVEAGDARNEVLELWKAIGGRDEFIQGLKNLRAAIDSVITPIKQAWRDLFPKKTASDIYYITLLFRRLTESMIKSEEAGTGIYRVFKILFMPIKTVTTVIKIAAAAVVYLVSKFNDFIDMMLNVIGSGNSVIDIIGRLSEESQILSVIFDVLGIALGLVIAPLKLIAELIKRVIDGFKLYYNVEKTAEVFIMLGNSIKNVLLTALTAVVSALSTCFKFMTDHLPTAESMAKAITWIANAFNLIGGVIGGAFRACASFFAAAVGAITDLTDNTKSLSDAAKTFKDIWDEKMGPLGKQLSALFGSVFSRETIGKVTTMTSKLNEFFNSLSAGQVITLAIVASVLLFMRQLRLLMKATTSVVNSFSGLEGVLKGIKGYFVALTNAVKYSALLQIGAGFLLIASAMWILSRIPTAALHDVAAVMGGLAIAIAVLMTAMSAINATANNAWKIGSTMAAFGIGIMMIAAAMKTLAEIDYGNNKYGPVNTLISMLGGVSLFIMGMAVMSRLVPQMSNIALQMVAFGAALLLMSKAFSACSSAIIEMKNSGIEDASLIDAIYGIAVAIVAFAGAMRLVSKVNFGTGAGTIGVVLGFMLFLIAMKQAIKLGLEVATFFENFEENLDKNTDKLRAVILTFIGIFSSLAILVAIMNKGSKAMLIAALGVIAAIAAIKIAFNTMMSMDVGEGVKFLEYLKRFASTMLAFIGIIWAVSEILSGLTGAMVGWKSFVGMAALMLAAVLSLKLMQDMDGKKLILNGIELAVLMAALGVALRMASTVYDSAKNIKAMIGVIAAITIALGLLSFFDWDQLLPGAVTLGAVLVMLGKSLQMAGQYAGQLKTGPLIAMAVAIVAIGGTLVGLVALNADMNQVAKAAIGLGGAIIAVGLAAKYAGQSNWQSFAPLLAMSGVVVALGFAMSRIANATNGMSWEQIIAAYGGLAAVIAVCGLCVKLGESSGLASGAGTLAAMLGCAIAIVAIGFALAKLAELPIDQIKAAAIALDLTIAVLAAAIAAIAALHKEALIAGVVFDLIAAGCYGIAAAFEKFAQNVGVFADGVDKIAGAIDRLGTLTQETIMKAFNNIVDFGTYMVAAINVITPKMEAAMETSGQWVAIGLERGILKETQNGGVKLAAMKLWSAFKSQFDRSAGIASPSAYMAQDGAYVCLGFANGIVKTEAIVKQAANGMWYSYATAWDAAAGINGTQISEPMFKNGAIVVNSVAYGIQANAGVAESAAKGVAAELQSDGVLGAFSSAGLSAGAAWGTSAWNTVQNYWNSIKSQFNVDSLISDATGGILNPLDEKPKFLSEQDRKNYEMAIHYGATKEEAAKAIGYNPKSSIEREIAAMNREVESFSSSLGDGADAGGDFANALDDIGGGGGGGSAGAAADAIEETAESMEDILDVTQFASEAITYFKEQYDSQAKELLDIAPWEKAISATEDMVFIYAKLSGTLGNELDEFESFADLFASDNKDLAQEVRDLWVDSFSSIHDAISSGYGSVFTSASFAQGTIDLGEVLGFNDMQTNLQSQINQMTYFKNTLVKLYQEGLDEMLIQELLAGGPENLAQIVAWDRLTKEEIQEINKTYSTLQKTTDTLTMEIIEEQAKTWSGGVKTIANTIEKQVNNQDYASIQNSVNEKTQALLTEVLDADTNWESFQGTRLGELLDEGIASGVENMTEIATNACEQLGKEMMQSMMNGIEQSTNAQNTMEDLAKKWYSENGIGGSGGTANAEYWGLDPNTLEYSTRVGDAQYDRIMHMQDLLGAWYYKQGIDNYDPQRKQIIEGIVNAGDILGQIKDELSHNTDYSSSNLRVSQLRDQLNNALHTSGAAFITDDTGAAAFRKRYDDDHSAKIVVNQSFETSSDAALDSYVGLKSALSSVADKAVDVVRNTLRKG